jgi:hypothetical protein
VAQLADAPRRDDSRLDFALKRRSGFHRRALARAVAVDIGEQDGSGSPRVDLPRYVRDAFVRCLEPPLDGHHAAAPIERNHNPIPMDTAELRHHVGVLDGCRAEHDPRHSRVEPGGSGIARADAAADLHLQSLG